MKKTIYLIILTLISSYSIQAGDTTMDHRLGAQRYREHSAAIRRQIADMKTESTKITQRHEEISKEVLSLKEMVIQRCGEEITKLQTLESEKEAEIRSLRKNISLIKSYLEKKSESHSYSEALQVNAYLLLSVVRDIKLSNVFEGLKVDSDLLQRGVAENLALERPLESIDFLSQFFEEDRLENKLQEIRGFLSSPDNEAVEIERSLRVMRVKLEERVGKLKGFILRNRENFYRYDLIVAAIKQLKVK